MQYKQTLFLQIFGLVAFIEQKENNNNDNLCKIKIRPTKQHELCL